METGFYYLQTRYYDPDIGRFISPDSLNYLEPETINGLNLYVYCLNNPVMYSDPSGEFILTVSIFASSAILGGVLGFLGSIANDIPDYDWHNEEDREIIAKLEK